MTAQHRKNAFTKHGRFPHESPARGAHVDHDREVDGPRYSELRMPRFTEAAVEHEEREAMGLD